MKRIVVISDSRKIDTYSLEFGCYIAKLTRSKLTGVLLDTVPSELIPKMPEKQSYFEGKDRTAEINIPMGTDQASLYFMEEARKKGVISDVYINKGGPSDISLYESRFADLVVVSPDLSFMGDADDLPSSFVKHLLLKSECPVVLAPHSFGEINQIIFCYDGSPSSLYAIKQFTYLFPMYSNQRITLLDVRDSIVREADEGHMRTIAWLKLHYEMVEFHFLEGKADEELFLYFLNKKDLFIIMGAFGRNILSNFFNRSKSERIIKTVDLPLFIAHF